ncbi:MULTISPECIES: tripartite tricarboxylate transporter substrate binding protein [unclassified Shinella]|uniref:Bug family tripartite tricarboxylate transporter substrate binding protein n=1 Tax=unclassified Shinella TaxID=2643062 RepID=UPI00225D3319|nr:MULTISPECIES: tripartite tricarboxylate transporter substrate binding protein [unclassified Shinella]MCO5137091.1 tripartite tricarboxylate transporter substrate binding protein [Shinella sp.]MDC7253231.1 tripartite tricarboxylate transporter substrate binding protein [Shinella sp. YE25]CAI0340648.1 Tripartite tricarboxylate transporter receptor family protein [Rhizobiaceae bacterium]CAK7259004.1 putative tricarboxylic transport membrane protein [Shinella sp. WSC3-e]
MTTRRALIRTFARLGLAVLASGTLTGAAPVVAAAAGFPDRPVTIVVPFPPAGPPDLLARAIGEHLSKAWGRPVLVENKPGANGVVATQFVANAQADGYTILVGSVATHAMNRALRPDLPFDTLTAFEPVTQLGFTPMLITAHPSTGITTIAQLVEKAKAEPESITYASVGQGSAAHLAAELFQAAAGIRLVHVPYDGIAQASLDLISGQVDLGFSNVVNMLPYVKDGKSNALAVTDTTRAAILPDVPTLAEAYPGIDVRLWWGIFTPAGTPSDVIDKLSAEINVALKDKALIDKWAESATTIVGSTPADFKALVNADAEKWGKVIKDANIVAQ